MNRPAKSLTTLLRAGVLAGLMAGVPGAVLAVDPPYQGALQRLAEVMGSLYFLQPLCGFAEEDWRAEMAELIALETAGEDRRTRLYGAFNAGYTAYARLYRDCTPSARAAMARLLREAETTARDIHTRFGT